MNRIESGGERHPGKDLGSLRHLPVDRLPFDVPIDSPEYQDYLEANRARELAREEFGGPSLEAEERYQEAVRKVSKLARSLYSRRAS